MRTLIAVAAALLLAGCQYDLTGIKDLDRYAGEIASALIVGSVECPATTLEVGQSMDCVALSPIGTRLSVEGQSVVIWSIGSIATPDAATVDLGGRVTGISPGSVRVVAEGARGSVAVLDIQIE